MSPVKFQKVGSASPGGAGAGTISSAQKEVYDDEGNLVQHEYDWYENYGSEFKDFGREERRNSLGIISEEEDLRATASGEATE